jgi:thioredoxin 1
MATQINMQSATSAPLPSRFQTGCEKMMRAMRATQDIALKVLDYSTTPLTAYFVLSNLAFGYGANISFLKSCALSVISTSLAIPASIGFWRLKSLLLGRDAPVENKKTEEPESTVARITKENFQKEVLESKVPVVLDAYAAWCPPCQKMAPLFAEISQQMQGKIKFAKFDVDAEKDLAKELEVDAMPTFLFYQEGKIIDRQVGGVPKEEILLQCISHFLPAPK